MTPIRIALSLAVLVLLGSGAFVLACGGWKWLGAKYSDDLSVSATVTEIEVIGGGGNVEVTGVPGSQVDIHRSVRYLRPLHNGRVPRPSADGTIVRLDTSCGRFCVIDFQVRVPAETHVRGTLTSGDARLTGLSNVDIKTSSGDIEMTRVSGQVRARSSSGSIKGKDLRPTAIEVSASSGDISLSLAAPCDVRARTSSGDLDLAVPDGAYRIDATTSSGSRRIQVTEDPSSTYLLDLRTSSGDMTVARR